MKPRILHIFSSYGGGISSLLLNLIENSHDQIEHSLLAFSYKGGETFIKRMQATNTKVFLMARPRIDGFFKFIKSITRVLDSVSFDAIHCHIDGKSLFLFRMIAKQYKIKTFIVHAHKTMYESRWDRITAVHKLNRWSNFVFATNYMTCSDLASNYIFGPKYLERRSAYLIPNGINEHLFVEPLTEQDTEEFNQKFGVKPRDLIICHIGRMTLLKNHDFILQVIKLLKEQGFRFRLIFVGDGEILSDIMSKAKYMGVESHICFAGRRQDISKIMKYADLLILPSLREGLPTVAVECQAAGTHMFLSDQITTQCDMGLGLLSFLPLDVNIWADKIKEFNVSHMSSNDCLMRIKANRFTAMDAGNLYVEYVKEMINTNNHNL